MRRPRKFRAGTERYVLCHESCVAEHVPPDATLVDAGHAHSILRTALRLGAQHGLADAIRAFTRDAGHAERRKITGRVLAALAAPLDPLRLYRLAKVTHEAQAEAVIGVAPTTAVGPEPVDIVDLSWIELSFVDHRGQPLAGLAYTLTLPDGQEVPGASDADGLARHEGIASGSCELRIDNEDPSSWRRVG